MRVGRVLVVTSGLVVAAAAACVSTDGLDGTETSGEAGADVPVNPAETSTPEEDASTDGVIGSDAPATDGGTLNDLHEEFAQPLDSMLWFTYVVAPFSSTQASEQYHFVCNASTKQFAFIRTNEYYDARTGSVRVNLVTAGKAGTTADGNTAVAWFKIVDASSSGYGTEIGVENGELYAKHFVANVQTKLKTMSYVPLSMAWLRMRMADGGVAYEYAQSENGTWTELASETAPMPLNAVKVELGSGAFPGIPGEVIFDHLHGAP